MTLAAPGSAAADERRAFRVVSLDDLRELEPTHDGGLLVTRHDTQVIHIDRRWRTKRVAGRGDEDGYPYRGEGGKATRAWMSAADVAALPDGGFLIADTYNCRIHRVGRNGIIRTVAGSGPRPCIPPEPCYTEIVCPDSPAPVGDGGPATAARLQGPMAIAETGDGGFLIADTNGNRIRRVAPDGTISTVAGTGQRVTNLDIRRGPYSGRAVDAALRSPSEISPTDDGGFIFSDSEGHHKVGPDGLILTLLPRPAMLGRTYQIADDGTLYDLSLQASEQRGEVFQPLLRFRDAGFFPVWGERLPNLRSDSCCIGDVERLTDGGFVAATERELIYAAPRRTARFAAAIDRKSLRSLQRRRITVRSTLDAEIYVELSRGGPPLAEVVLKKGHRGLNRISFPKRLPGGLYTARLVAIGPGGARATETRNVLVGSVLPRRLARQLAAEAWEDLTETGGGYAHGCRRFGRRRVDCVIGFQGDDGSRGRRCVIGLASVLARSGYIVQRRYRCRSAENGFLDKRPTWRGPAVEAPSPDVLVFL